MVTRDLISNFPGELICNHFTPTGSTNLRAKLGWQDKTVFLSMRSFENLYDVKSIVHAFFQASDLRQDLRLMVFGQGTQETLLKEIVEAGGFEEKVYFGGHASLEELPDIYRSADLYISASHSDGASVSLDGSPGMRAAGFGERYPRQPRMDRNRQEWLVVQNRQREGIKQVHASI